MRIWLSLLIVLMIGTACGVKGPLYLPEKRYPQPASKPNPTPEPTKTPNPSE